MTATTAREMMTAHGYKEKIEGTWDLISHDHESTCSLGLAHVMDLQFEFGSDTPICQIGDGTWIKAFAYNITANGRDMGNFYGLSREDALESYACAAGYASYQQFKDQFGGVDAVHEVIEN